MNKKILSIIFVLLMLLGSFSACSKTPADIDNKIDQAVSKVLLEDSKVYSKYGECYGEGHIVLGYDKVHTGYKVYTISTSAMYGFENNNFVAIVSNEPMPMIVELNDDLLYRKLISVKNDKNYTENIQQLFPKEYHQRLSIVSAEDKENLFSQRDKYAYDYLTEIGRTAYVGNIEYFKDSYKSYDDYLIDSKISKSLMKIDRLKDYPFWNGSREIVDNGTRYVYSTKIDLTNERIVYSKTNYDTNEILELYYYSIKTGEELK